MSQGGKKYKILIADDEKKIREAIRDYLEAKGFSVILAKDGAEAAEKAADEALDLIILDVLMPNMNGIEACKEIREFSDVPIVFLSALGEEADLLKGFGAGADDYVVKPFFSKELMMINFVVSNSDTVFISSKMS